MKKLTKENFGAWALITGASSGIGRALAIDYAGPEITLFLSGRNEERLMAVKKLCEISAGPHPHRH